MRIKDAPEKLQPFLFHRVEVEPWNENTTEAEATCPLCEKTRHFHINLKTGQCHCKRCSILSGNIYGFLQWLCNQSCAKTSRADLEELAHERRVTVEQMQAWQVSKSVIDGTWQLPAHNKDKRLGNLYRYCKPVPDAKRIAMSTPTCNHHLFGMHLFNQSHKTTFIKEGPWDGMAWRGLLKNLKLLKTNTLGAPGCNTFREQWANLFPGHTVYLGFDNDHPAGEHRQIAGWEGVKRAAQILLRAKSPPEKILVLKWGENGYDPSLPTGFDIRDALNTF